LYGGSGDPLCVSVNAKQVVSILKSEAGHNTIFTLKVSGAGEDKVIVKDWQTDPVRGDLLHVDLLRIAMDVRMRVKVPVHTFGEPQGVKLQGGVFEMVTRVVEVECLPTDIPEEFRVDVSDFMIGKQLRAGDLPFDPTRIKLVTDPQRVLAHVVALRAEEEKPAELAATEAAAPVEPEVIKKGKKEVEEGEEVEAEPEKKKEKEKEK
jgi:large subunit ribosomal protein L25